MKCWYELVQLDVLPSVIDKNLDITYTFPNIVISIPTILLSAFDSIFGWKTMLTVSACLSNLVGWWSPFRIYSDLTIIRSHLVVSWAAFVEGYSCGIG